MSQQVNLYHPIFRKQEKKFSARTMLQAGVFIMVAIVLMYAYGWVQVGYLRVQAGQIGDQYAQEVKRLQDASSRLAARKSDPQLEQEAQRLEARIAAVQHIREISKHDYFAGIDGYSKYFIAFSRQRLSGLWLTGFTITGAGEQLVLEGRTETPELVPQYLQKLSAEKLLAGTTFEIFHMTRPAGVGVQDPTDKGMAPYVDFVIKTSESGQRP